MRRASSFTSPSPRLFSGFNGRLTAASPRKSAENIDPITTRQKNFAFTAVFSKHGVHLAYRPVHINRLRKVKVWLRNLNTTSTRTPSAKSFATDRKSVV